ncbi:hypothetical protein [Cryobacterium sp. SO1]|uniref:hypothetical protein n=1 Tax=Cryobacterium sp. SO1 TaxID=1897061 RepID=UPI0010230BF1|nr:hypothetical protein [Cryobacterium sp. SO1]RZI35318.1 hypothetical protein BJQ95_02385 [Cryobacterium sp. SO1]
MESEVIDDLNAHFTDAPAADRPPEFGSRFIVVHRTGGVLASRVSDNPILVVECYDATPEQAYQLAAEVREHLAQLPRRLTTDPRVYKVVETAGPASLPDPRSTSHRYTQTIAVHTRGRRAE